MHWLMLALAGIFEIIWAVAMKYSHGFALLAPSVVTVICYIASAAFLSLALRQLPLGTAYAMWTGFGIIGTSVLGIFLFGERPSYLQFFFILLIAIGIGGLKLLAKE